MPIGSVGIVISYLIMYLSFLQSLVCIDPLTGIGNCRETMSCLKSKIGKLASNGNFFPFFHDVDYFKQINVTHGHGKVQ